MADAVAQQRPAAAREQKHSRRTSTLGLNAPQTESVRRGKIAGWLFCWYFCSMMTLFMNKYYMTDYKGSPQDLAMAQMLMSLATGFIAVKTKKAPEGWNPPPLEKAQFYKQMVFVGLLRFCTVMLGLLALHALAVSFTEVVKSSAPFVTVIFSRLIVGEKLTWLGYCSLLPVVLGLALSSYSEVSFNWFGFGAAMTTNLFDCIQNVYSKTLLKYHTAVQLQFYATCSAMFVQVPFMIYTSWGIARSKLPWGQVAFLMADGFFFYAQSICAYGTVALMTPVSMSVANCTKRAVLIWLSVFVFGNKVGPANVVGTVLLLAGVLFYNYARTSEAEFSCCKKSADEEFELPLFASPTAGDKTGQ